MALPAARPGDAPPPSLLEPAMLVLLYRVVVGVVPAPPADVNTAERLQGFLATRPDLALSWTREQRRGFLTRLDMTALVSADRGAGEVVHSAPGLALGADCAPCGPGSAWATLLAGSPVCFVQDPAVRYDFIISAPVIRAPIEDEYPVWLVATVYRVKAFAARQAYPNLLYMPIPGPYLLRLPSTPPSSHANSEQRARRRCFLFSWNHQEFWRLAPVMRTQFFPAVPTWFAQMETPIGFITGGSLVAYCARDEIYRSCRNAHSVTMAIWVTEYLVMARNGWSEEARDGGFWLFSDALYGWVKQLEREELAGDDADALGFLQAMLALRAALPVQYQAFHDAVRRLDTSHRDRDGWFTVVTRHGTDVVRIVMQDPLDAAAYSIPASCVAVPPEARLGRAQVPLASVGVPSGWASAVAQRTGGSGSLRLGGLPLPGHQLVPPPRASPLASPVTLATTAPSSRADPTTPVVSTVARVADPVSTDAVWPSRRSRRPMPAPSQLPPPPPQTAVPTSFPFPAADAYRRGHCRRRPPAPAQPPPTTAAPSSTRALDRRLRPCPRLRRGRPPKPPSLPPEEWPMIPAVASPTPSP